MIRCIFILHTSGNTLEELPFSTTELSKHLRCSTLEPIAKPPHLDYGYKYLSGQYYHIPIIWWASDSEVVPQVGWYVDTPNDPAETTCWGLDVRVIRVKLCRDYCIDPARISHVEVTCRVAYEEG